MIASLPCKSLKFKIYAETLICARPTDVPTIAFLPCAGHRRRAGHWPGDIGSADRKPVLTVTVLGRNRATLDEAVASGAAQFAAVADVADQASVKSAIAEAAARQPIDILVANAGAAESAPFGRSDAALFQRMMDVNFMGVVHATQAVLPGDGRASPRPHRRRRIHRRPEGLCLCLGLQRCQARGDRSGALAGAGNREERCHRQRRMSSASPKPICSKASIDNIIKKTGRSREQAIAELAKHNPQGRLGAPSEVADAVLWLCGEGAGAITGQAIAVAGGEV